MFFSACTRCLFRWEENMLVKWWLTAGGIIAQKVYSGMMSSSQSTKRIMTRFLDQSRKRHTRICRALLFSTRESLRAKKRKKNIFNLRSHTLFSLSLSLKLAALFVINANNKSSNFHVYRKLRRAQAVNIVGLTVRESLNPAGMLQSQPFRFVFQAWIRCPVEQRQFCGKLRR